MVCMATTFDQGFKNDGGLGGYLGHNLSDGQWVRRWYVRCMANPDTLVGRRSQGGGSWLLRLMFDTLFFVLLLTIMLNIVFGIIIDTFADLRTLKKEKEDDMLNSCFVCRYVVAVGGLYWALESPRARRGNTFSPPPPHTHTHTASIVLSLIDTLTGFSTILSSSTIPGTMFTCLRISSRSRERK